MINENLPKTRKEAKEKGEKFYCTGKPCKRGHIDDRRTSTGYCMSCYHIEYETNQKDYLIRAKQQRQLYKKEIKEYKKKWYIENKEHVINKVQDYMSKPENRKRYNDNRNKNRKENPIVKLNHNIGSAIRSSLKERKAGRHWEQLVDFTLQDLIQHLESQFEDWMNWQNHGVYNKKTRTWNIDHIKPISLCDSFEEAWQLSNLQPLEAIKNLEKNNKYIG